jgi:hypothetical protein
VATFFVGTGSFLMLGVRVGALTGARHAGTALRSFITSVNPCLVGGVRTVVSGRKAAVQRAGGPDLLRFTGSVNHRCGEADRGDSKQTVSYDRVNASRNRCSVAPFAT